MRDAACYVCWAFARAYSPAVMKPFIKRLAASMLITCLYDREINCRRAASAAFQENVGRQGNENFPDGIEIITIADYFSLGNRTSAYLSIAPEIGTMGLGEEDDNHATLMFHLADVKMSHWDTDIRKLSARALAQLVPSNPARATEVRVCVCLCLCACLSVSASESLCVAHPPSPSLTLTTTTTTIDYRCLASCCRNVSAPAWWFAMARCCV